MPKSVMLLAIVICTLLCISNHECAAGLINRREGENHVNAKSSTADITTNRKMWKIQLILLVICCISTGLAIRSCSSPTPYYNTYINNPRADKCPDGTTAQCVSPVFKLGGAPNTGSWIKGKKVNANCKSIPKNTAIATFSGSGGTKYDGDKGHAGVFLYCLPNGSIRVADQWCGHKFSERTLPKSCSSSKPYSNCADYFYTIEW